MKTQPTTPVRHLASFVRTALLVASTCSLAASETKPAATTPKTHRLFMGSNLTIVAKDVSLPVKDVRGNAFVVTGPKGDLVVSAQDKQFQIEIDNALKLTHADNFAQVDNITFERAYSYEKDPMRDLEDSVRMSAYMSDAADMAKTDTLRAELVAEARGDRKFEADQWLKNPKSVNSTTTANMETFSATTATSRMGSAMADEAFDAIRINLRVSSSKRLTTPYVIILMRFLEQKDRPEKASVWVYAEKLPDIDEKPRKVSIMRSGFPPGYHIDSHHVHLYEGTSEIATNVSPKQMELTEDEAFQYSVIQHITANRDKTVAATKSAFFWPQDLHNRLSLAQLTRTLFVKVSKDGKSTGLFEDKACSHPIADSELAALAPELRFLPALDKGKPVESIAAIKLRAQ